MKSGLSIFFRAWFWSFCFRHFISTPSILYGNSLDRKYCRSQNTGLQSFTINFFKFSAFLSFPFIIFRVVDLWRRNSEPSIWRIVKGGSSNLYDQNISFLLPPLAESGFQKMDFQPFRNQNIMFFTSSFSLLPLMENELRKVEFQPFILKKFMFLISSLCAFSYRWSIQGLSWSLDLADRRKQKINFSRLNS